MNGKKGEIPFFFFLIYVTEYEIRLRFIRAKLRNVCYYWNYDKSLGEIRERRQYMHILRELRKQCLDLVKIEENEFLRGIISLIDPKVGKEEIEATIIKLEDYAREKGA